MSSLRGDISAQSGDIDVFRDKPLGSGAYGIVCRARYNKLPCAAKLLHPTFLVPGNWAVDKFMQECSFLASLKHPNIVQFLGVHTEKTTGQAALLMELMEESLTMMLKRHKTSNQLVPIHVQVDICHDIALAIHYLHSAGIIHRDLSSNNVLLIGGRRAKITDFGMSKLTLNVSASLSTLTQVPGSPVYMPPEAWISPPIYTEKLDIFSFGVLMLQIATCRQPNPGPSESLVSSESSPTGYVKVPVPELERRSDDIECLDTDHILRELTLSCLQDKSDPRPLASEICDVIEALKLTSQYSTSNSLKSSSSFKNDVEKKGSKTSLIYDSRRTSVPDNEKTDSLKKELSEKEISIEKLTSQVTKLSSEVSSLKSSLLKKEQELNELQQQQQKKSEAHAMKRNSSSSFDGENVCLSGLSPEVLAVISKDPSSCVPNFSVGYHDIGRGEVSFRYFPEYESKEQTISIFLQFYQHIFNSCQVKVGFIPIPSFFPKTMIPDVLKLCSAKQNECSFKHIQVVDMIKIISTSPEIHKENTQRVSDLLNLRARVDNERTLIIKQGNIIDEDVSIIVSSANPSLTHRFGISAAINAASLFEVQKYATAYVHQHGSVDVGCIAHTRAGGNLKCNWVIHAVGPTGIKYEDEKLSQKLKEEVLKIMRELIHKILHKAEELQAKSIAIPAISTGNLQLAISLAITGILEGILEHKFISSSQLTDIRLVILRKDIFANVAEAFVNYQLKASDVVSSRRQSAPLSASSSPLTSSSSNTRMSSSTATSSCKHQ